MAGISSNSASTSISKISSSRSSFVKLLGSCSLNQGQMLCCGKEVRVWCIGDKFGLLAIEESESSDDASNCKVWHSQALHFDHVWHTCGKFGCVYVTELYRITMMIFCCHIWDPKLLDFSQNTHSWIYCWKCLYQWKSAKIPMCRYFT